MNCIPTSNRVIVNPIQSTGPASVIITPESSKRMPTEGVVLAVGQWSSPLGVTVPPPCKKGDRICFIPAGPYEFKMDGENVLCIDEKDILVVFPKN